MAFRSRGALLALWVASSVLADSSVADVHAGLRASEPDLGVQRDCVLGSIQSVLSGGLCSGANTTEGAVKPAENITTWLPWTHEPYCVDDEFCVYTNGKFHNGHGISVISPRRAMIEGVDVFERAFDTPFTRGPADDSDLPLEVRPVEGKGMGTIATRKIRRGEVFLFEYAAIAVDPDFLEHVQGEPRVKAIETALSQLPDPRRVTNLAMRGVPGLSEAEDVLRTNTHGATFNGRGYTVLFPKVAVSIDNSR